MRIELMGVPIDAVTREEAVQKVRAMLNEPRGHLLTTPNPEMLVRADRDAPFKEALRSADLAIPDGFGLLLVGRLKGWRIPERIPGSEFVDDVAAEAVRRDAGVYLLGGRGDVAEKAANALRMRHSGLRIVGAESGGALKKDADGAFDTEKAVLQRISSAGPEILLVAFGHGAQELWIRRHLADLPTVRLAMGVGGTFDFLAGTATRAPKFLRNIGMEWLWRLITEPWRIRRIWTAVAVFPWLALRRKR
jgi:N-acetylglucosaminyldiphosphoundecaprenol N-acetyl-beta-D-mannosaminyltransferase